MRIFLILLVITIAVRSSGQTSFFKPIPKPAMLAMTPATVVKKKEWRPIIALPALKIVESARADSKIDALLLTSTGGGISWEKLYFDAVSNKWKSNFSFSPLTILLSGNLSSASPIDISYATTIGFFNNLLMVGVGYDLGAVSGRSRFFGLLSVGIALNN